MAAEGTGTPTGLDVQRRVLAYWDATGVPARALAGTADGPVFRFTEGPPTANGPPHLGHLVGRVVKDLQLRYRRMRGYRLVSPMAGWDCHGLAVELEIEKRHGLRSHHDIEAYGVEKFCDECRADTLRVASLWQEMSRQIGYWLDYDHAYRTMDPPYVESVWWSLKTLFDRGLLERGHYVLPYCPRCETSLSSHEVAQGYREATDPSVTIRLPLVGSSPRRELLVWTTTPWTLPANLLVAARRGLAYAVVRAGDGTELVLAADAVARYFPEGAEVVERLEGSTLEGRTYTPPFDTPGPGAGRYRVVLDDFVTTEEGTGLVHIAPSFGPDDLRIGARERVGTYDPLDPRGRFTEAVPLVRGIGFKAADPALLKDLEARGRLYRAETIRHTYPFCYRCDTPLLYRAIDSWFVRTSRVTERLVALNGGVDWVPPYLRDGRFGNFLTEAKDWALSRSRYWGTPLPIWRCRNGHDTCVGSFAELAERLGTPLPTPFDPHRVGLDRLALRCGRCGETTEREPYTIDAWYDSGAAPFAQFHYPFEPGPFDPAAPLDYIAEGLDQTRGWFYSLLVLATTLFDRPAYRACLTTGLVLDAEGRKMSKSRGNALDPLALLGRLGGDALRWTFLAIDFTEPMRLSEAGIEAAAGRTLGTLRNVVTFYGGAGVRTSPDPTASGPPSSPSVLDRWLLSRLEGTRVAVERALERYDPRPAATAVATFVDDLSAWYLRRSRPRFRPEADAEDRRRAEATLGYALLGFARTIAPLLPTTSEWIQQEVGGGGFLAADRSVHLLPWPGTLAQPLPAIEEGMAELRDLVEIGRELRQRAGVKARVPLPELVVFGVGDAGPGGLGAEGELLLAGELNVRRVRRAASEERARYGEDDWVVREEDGRPRAALSRRPTEELRDEGLAREVARRLQQRRKELGLRYGETVAIELALSAELERALAPRREALARELGAEPLTLTAGALAAGPEVGTWEFEGHRFSARVHRPTVPRPGGA